MGTVDATASLLARDPLHTGLLLDFDGSLAPIVLMPDEAVALPGTAEVLAALAKRLALVAIVSGRPVEYLARRVPAEGVRLVGQYGLEWMENGRVVVDQRALPYVQAVAEAASEAESRWPDLLIERKGQVAVGVHWRRDPGAGDDVATDVEALGRRLGLEVHPSRMARELRPPVPVDKGTVVEQLLEGLSVAAFAGDDSGDLPAFAALERLRSQGRLDDAVRIAVSSPESPPEVLANADLVVEGPEGLRTLLNQLARRASIGDK
ncbi:MAG: HAD-superfamily hydrolase subfamily [Actinomycetia bacterium]|nr:HAD-superfamily hydrolase subfamily [Actinomycetes bacterium]